MLMSYFELLTVFGLLYVEADIRLPGADCLRPRHLDHLVARAESPKPHPD
jgi:hypothetical protein